MERHFALAIVFYGLATMADASATATAQSPAPKTEDPSPRPMVFFVATGEANACGPGCSEWIAADGEFDVGAAERFGVFLNRLGARKLPVYFRTPGGNLPQALAIGRLMRARQLTAGVATTVPQGCVVTQLDTDACMDLKRSGRVLVSKFDTDRTRCRSACVFALAGAVTRDIPASGGIFIHAFAVMKRDKNGHLGREIDTEATRKFSSGIVAQLSGYLREMGIRVSLVEAIQKVPHDQSRELSRKEIAQYGIDARTFVESNWNVEILGVKKSAMERETDGTDYRFSTFRMTCSGRGYASVYYTRDIGSNDAAAALAIKVTAGGRDFMLPPGKSLSMRADSATRLIMTEARLPAVFFKPAAASDHILLTDVVDQAQARRPPHVVKLSTVGLAEPLAALLEQCDPNDPELAASPNFPAAVQTSQ